MGIALENQAAIEEHYAPLIRHCPFPVLIADADMLRVQISNVQPEVLAGLPLEKILGPDFAETLLNSPLDTGHDRSLSCDTVPAFRLDDAKAIARVTCESLSDTRLYVIVVQPSRRRRDRSHPVDVEPNLPNPANSEVTEAERALREQEIRFRALADSVPVGIFLTNLDGRVMYVNDRWSGITGRNSNETLLHGWLDTAHPDDRAYIETCWQRFLTEPGPFEEEFRCTTPAGDIWVAARVIAFNSENGNRAGYLGTLMDVTSRREAEQALKSSETRYRRIFENVLDVYYETSLTGEILELSPSIETLSGYTRQELLGQNMLSFYTNTAARGKLLEHLGSGSGALHDYEIELFDRAGRTVPCSISCKLERDENGEPIKIIGSLRDIRRRKSAEDMLRVERKNLELIAKDMPFQTILESIVESVEAQAPGMLCSVLLVDPEGKRLTLGAAPSLPPEYNKRVDGLPIGPNQGCCGHAAHTKACAVTEDIATDPNWEQYRDLAIKHGLRACWSQPILGPNGKVLGTFAMYYQEPQVPSSQHRQLIEAASRLAAVAIERRDIAEEQRSLEAQVRQAQKLESLGVLAGGIAHDFNNLLTGIMGYASLASFNLREENSPSLKHVDEIQKVAQRAAGLTKQMLAYSGKGKFVTMPLNLGQAVEELAHLLRISISKKARLLFDFDDHVPLVEADPAQVQQVVMNLITNASEALEDEPGDITIATGVVYASREYLAESYIDDELPAGDYVFVEVTDTGCGMDPTTLARIFDPFYTTKFTGRGLGMSAVLGIMRGHRGTIKVDSVIGVGTTIRVLFPAIEKRTADGAPDRWSNTVMTKDAWRGEATVLVVDDEDVVLNLAANILAADGFKVLTAVDGDQCLDLYETHANDIDLVLLDLTMPNKDGVETFRSLRETDPDARVVLSSGYNEQEVKDRIGGDGFYGFVQKPYTRDALLEAIHDALNA